MGIGLVSQVTDVRDCKPIVIRKTMFCLLLQ
jgi:hypothetical protein